MRPFRGYRALAADEVPSTAGAVARLLFATGAFVALTSTGRLAPFEVVTGAISFAYVPVVQALALACAVRAVARGVDLRPAYAFYLQGHGPWFLFFAAVSGVCLFAPSPASVLLMAVPPVVLGTLAWGGLLTYACFRSALGLSRARALGATAVFYVVLATFVLGWFVAMGQLLPILPRP